MAAASGGRSNRMPTIPAPSVPASQVGRAAHDLGLAGMLGGNLYGRLALHPSVTAISDPRERGRVVNAAWRRYGVVNGLSLAAVAGGWAGARMQEAADHRLAPGERRLAYAKDALVALTAVTGLVTAAEGLRFARMEPAGAVPLEDGDTVAAEAGDDAARAKRRLNALGIANLAAQAALVSVNAALAQYNYRRPGLRRAVSALRR